ncbi:MAG: hypothetical protein HQL54_02090 [Magnetococcales bacterium]|nr:hypothetical protein [Magnetococcales bacterium]
MNSANPFIVIAGPSGIGKSPLLKGLNQLFPDLGKQLQPLVLYNDRAKRPGEKESVAYFFRNRNEIEALREKPGHLVVENRGDLQGLEISQIETIQNQGNWPIYEGNVFMVDAMRKAGLFEQQKTITLFLSPVSLSELQRLIKRHGLTVVKDVVEGIQRRKLTLRSRNQQSLHLPDYADVARRAAKAWEELNHAPNFDYVIPLYDGESHDHWELFGTPLGSARMAIEAFAECIQGSNQHPIMEKWPCTVFESA